MAIEFYCPGCAKLMRTPDETAGRKGKCPSCGLKVQIPATSVASPSSSDFGRPAASFGKPASATPAPPSASSDRIEFPCSQCGKFLSVPAANAGKKGKCPQCGSLMPIPQRTASSFPAAPPRDTPTAAPLPFPSAPKERWKGTPAAAPSTNAKIHFRCPQCQRQVSVTATAAGQKGRCPQCQGVFTIPRQSTVPPPSTAPAAVAVGNDLLLPLDNMAWQPSDALQPLGPAPATNDPLGLGPLAYGDPLAAGGSPLTTAPAPFPQQPFNPYASPSYSTAPKRSAKAGSGMVTATQICGGFLIFYAVFQIILLGLSFFLQQGTMLSMLEQARQEADNEAAYTAGFIVGQAVVLGLGGVFFLLVVAGGIQMIRLRTWGLCLAACILTMLPCNCFCLLGLPIGVWGIVMLSQSPVRAAFG